MSYPKVAVILSQDWCPDWKAMQRWLQAWLEHKKPAEDIVVYTYLYNLQPHYLKFLSLKENTWGNFLIPYVRYYCRGHFVSESNYVTPEGFLRNLGCQTLLENTKEVTP
jgi:regulator of sigma D